MTADDDPDGGPTSAWRPGRHGWPGAVHEQHEMTWNALRAAVTLVETEIAKTVDTTTRDLVQQEVLALLDASSNGHMSMSSLGKRLGVSSGGMTRIVDRLADDGLADRSRSVDDRRVIYATITDAGRRQARIGAALRARVLQRVIGTRLDPLAQRHLTISCVRIASAPTKSTRQAAAGREPGRPATSRPLDP